MSISTKQRIVYPAFAWGMDEVLSPDGTPMKNILRDPLLRKALGILPIQGGGARGFNTEADVVTTTADGIDLNDLWRVYQETIARLNAVRTGLVGFLSYQQTQPVETVPQFGGTVDFEVASEFGVPRSARQSEAYFQLGFPFEWYDLAERYTWKFLVDATAAQIDGIHNAVIEADNRLVFTEVMRTLFRNTNRTATIKNNAYNVYALYNNDGTVPPAYRSNTFAGSHTHYLSSGAATVDSGDLDEMEDHLTHHGYSNINGTDLVLMVNKAQGDTIRNFRSIANAGTARYDFVPSQNTPRFLLPISMVTAGGTPPPAQIAGLMVIGSYGQFTIIQEDYIPAGYMVGFATGGTESLTNPIGIREHANVALRGLRLAKGRNPDYPLQDAIYGRGFGAGIRQRGGAVIMKVTAGAYSIPTQYV